MTLTSCVDVNTAGAEGFEEPFSNAGLIGITGGQENFTSKATTTTTGLLFDMAEPPAIPDIAEPPTISDAAELPILDVLELTDNMDSDNVLDIPDVGEHSAFALAAEPPAIFDVESPAIVDLADPFDFDESTVASQETGFGTILPVGDEADNMSRLSDKTEETLSTDDEGTAAGNSRNTAQDWTESQPENSKASPSPGELSDTPLVPKAVLVPSMFAEDAADSVAISQFDQVSNDAGVVPSALPSQVNEHEDVFSSSEEPPAIEKVTTSTVHVPPIAGAEEEPHQTSEILQEDDSMFPKVNAPAVQKHQEAGFFLSEEETMEVSLEGPPAQPKIKTLTTEVSLDDDDDGLFSTGVLDTSSAQVKNSSDVSAPSTLPPMGAPITPPIVSPSSDLPQAPIYSANNDATNANNITTPPMPAALSGGQPAGFYAPPQPNSIDRMVSGNANTDGEFIEILISEPQKVGDGMGSFMAYKMTTRTNISFFRKQCWSVTRRFSDYLGLHAKLVEKHLHAGRIIPPAPEKDALNTTKLRLSSGEGADGAAEFLERRRASLQRYMQRTAALPHLRTDPDFREFVELDSDLPRATQTSAMSSAGVLRLFNRVGETVNKITFKMEESDQWFEERAQQVEALEAELRRLHGALEGLAGGRRELAAGSSALSKAAAVLSSVEEHSALSRALHQLAEATDRTHTVYHAQADADFYILCETTRDYINLIGAVKEVFHERVKVFQAWQYSQTMLAKKREAKAKLELTARQEKVAQAQQEVQEWEGKVERNQEHFERISGAIKKELEQFDVVRVQDFKSMLVRYLEAMVTSQQQVIKVWESFLPEAKAIS